MLRKPANLQLVAEAESNSLPQCHTPAVVLELHLNYSFDDTAQFGFGKTYCSLTNTELRDQGVGYIVLK